MKTISPVSVPASDACALLLDVRTPAEFAEIHAPGSVLVPLHALDPVKVRGMMAGKTGCYLLCRSGTRAKQAAAKLHAAGLDNLFVVEGGMEGWAAAGLSVNRGRRQISLERQVRITAGILVLLGATLGYFVALPWVILSALVGGGLLFSGLTDTCGLGMLLARMPWNNHRTPDPTA